MQAPKTIFVLMDARGLDFGVFGNTRQEVEDYIVGELGEHIYEFSFVREHPINVDFQQDPEDNDASMG